MKLERRTMLMSAVLALVLVAAAENQFLFKPQLEKIYRMKAEKSVMSEKIRKAGDALKGEDKLKSSYDVMLSKIGSLSSGFYSDDIKDRILAVLEEHLKKSSLAADRIIFTRDGISLSEINQDPKGEKISSIYELASEFKDPATAADTAGINDPGKKDEAVKPSYPYLVDRITAAIHFTGSYQQLTEFIRQLEELDRSIAISNLNISADEAGQLAGDIQVDFYYIHKIVESVSDDDNGSYPDVEARGDPFEP